MSRREKGFWGAVLVITFSMMVGTAGVVLLDTTAAPVRSSGQVEAGQYDIRLGPGTWKAQATVVISVAANGTVSVSIDESQPIFLGTAGPVPPDTPNPQEPTDPKLKALSSSLKSIPVPSNGRAAIAKLYRDLAPLTAITTADGLKTTTNALFSAAALAMNQSDADAWKAWKSSVDQSIVSSGVSSHAEHVAAWLLIADHLD